MIGAEVPVTEMLWAEVSVNHLISPPANRSLLVWRGMSAAYRRQ